MRWARWVKVDVIAEGDEPCGVTTPRTEACSITPARKGWRVNAELIGEREGTSKWKVIRGKVRPANELAKQVKNGCA